MRIFDAKRSIMIKTSRCVEVFPEIESFPSEKTCNGYKIKYK